MLLEVHRVVIEGGAVHEPIVVEELEAAAEEAGVPYPLVVRLVLLHDAVVVLGEVGQVLGRVGIALLFALELDAEPVVVGAAKRV